MRKFPEIFIFVACLLVFQTAIAKTDQTFEKLKVSMWNDPDFKTTKFPDKWKNESAVILAKSYLYEVKKEIIVNFIYENIYLHKRIKLLDKAAVNEFSEFSFEKDYKNFSFWAHYESKDMYIGIKVIKPSGKENIIDLKDAVINEIKEGYKRKEYKKIAIPDLEIGDIVDYFYVVKNTYIEKYMKIMDPVFYLLVEQYPIVKQTFNIHTLRQMYFNSKSINGAPELKLADKDDETSYSFVDNNREKSDVNLWAYPFRIYPTVKFQAFFIKNEALNYLDFLTYFLGDKKSNNSYVDLAHIDKLVKKIYKTDLLFDLKLRQETENYLKSNFDKNCPSDTIVKYTYYYLRQKTDNYEINSLMLNLSYILQKRKIQHDLVITIPNYVSDISDLILPKELAYLIRIKGNPDYFIGDFSPLSIFKCINTDYQGNNAYAISNPDLVKNLKVEKIVIPIDKPEANQQVLTLQAKFSEKNMDSLLVNIDKSLKGPGRYEDIAYTVTGIKYEDEVLAGLTKTKEKSTKKKSKQLKEEKERNQKQEQQQKDAEDALKKLYKNQFNAGDDFKISSYSLMQMGIWENSPELKYNVKFTIGNMVKKMGPNYMVSIGKLITSQLELSRKDLERNVDIYAPYPRTFEYKIILEIPSGYKVKGLEKLNVNINNQTGGFTGKAEVQNNKLIVNVKKYYSHNYEKVSEWPKMVEFIEAAFNFTQQNILLEKQ